MGFRVINVQKCKKKTQKNPACIVFFLFLSRHYGFMNYFEIKNFVFSNIIPSAVCNL